MIQLTKETVISCRDVSYRDAPLVVDDPLIAKVDSILDADNQSEDFLLGLASGQAFLLKTGGLSDSSLELVSLAILRACALSLEKR